MKEHKVNALDNFICGWYIDPQVADDLVKYFSDLGFNCTSLDLEGLISGKLNR